jgi:hypothetical protein
MDQNQSLALRTAFSQFLESVPLEYKNQIPNIPLEIEILESSDVVLSQELSQYLDVSSLVDRGIKDELHLFITAINKPVNSTLSFSYKIDSESEIAIINEIPEKPYYLKKNTNRRTGNEKYQLIATWTSADGSETLSANVTTIMDDNNTDRYMVMRKMRKIEVEFFEKNLIIQIKINMYPPVK